MFAENLDIYLKDFGHPCSVGGQAFLGIPNSPDDQMLMGGVNITSTMYVLIVKSSDVAAYAIKAKTAIVVDGVNFEVRDPLMLDDGAFTQLTLSKS